MRHLSTDKGRHCRAAFTFTTASVLTICARLPSTIALGSSGKLCPLLLPFAVLA